MGDAFMSIHQLAAYPLDRITIPTCCHTRSMMAGEQYMPQVDLLIRTRSPYRTAKGSR